MTRSSRVIAAVAISLGTVLVAPGGLRAAACKSTCTEELRACRHACGGQHAQALQQCRARCGEQSTCNAPGVRAGTFVWVENVCSEVDGAVTLSQKLVTRHENCDPVTLLELPVVGPVADPLLSLGGTCPIFASFRVGSGSVVTGRFQRLAALPDQSGIVFELSNDHALFPGLTPEPPIEEGFYFVRPDGTGRPRWLGPPSVNPIIIVGASGFEQADATFPAISPNSRLLATTGIGPGPDGEPAVQIFLTRIASGERTQLTHLPPTPESIRGLNFADDRTIFYFDAARASEFAVGIDGSGPVSAPPFKAIPGAHLVQRFAIAGDGAVFVNVPLDAPLKRVYRGAFDRPVEIFRLEGQRALQLTNFGYPDALQVVPARHGAQFTSSADPLGENPAGVCQLFWIDALAGHLQQLTHFPYDGRPKNGCVPVGDVACTINGDIWDPRAGVTALVASCDPFGRNPDGEQGFTSRPDGTGLRQITAFRGREALSDGGVRVELGGPWGYSARLF